MKQKKQNIPPIVRGLDWVELNLAIDTMVQCVQMTNTLFPRGVQRKRKKKLKKTFPTSSVLSIPLRTAEECRGMYEGEVR